MRFCIPVRKWLYLDQVWNLIIRDQRGNTNFVKRVIQNSDIPHSAESAGTNVSFPIYTKFMLWEIHVYSTVPDDFQYKLRMEYVNNKGKTKEVTCWISQSDVERASFVEEKDELILRELENFPDERFANIEI